MADFYQIRLKANTDLQQTVAGKLILVDNIVGADAVDITPMLNGGTGRTMPGRKRAFKAWVDYDAIVLRSDTDCTVYIWLSSKDVSLGFADGANVNVAGGVSILNDQGNRVPVDLAGGNVNVTATNVGINNDDSNPVPTKQQLAGAVAHPGPVVVGAGAVSLLGASETRRGARFRNVGASPVAIGGADVTYANATDLIMPGETWNEIDAPGAAWFATCDAGGAATINISTVE